MANKTVQWILNIAGNASEKMRKISDEAEASQKKVSGLRTAFDSLSKVTFGIQNIVGTIQMASNAISQFTEANRVQQEAETKLAQVMKNTMGASMAEVQSIKDLASAQQALGVIGDEVQLSGAQELGTYLEKTESLKKLMPVMNDMLAQQYGLNATQEQAVTIGSMMGKVMEGQVGALSRYGYKFDEAQEKILKYGTEEQKVATLAEVISQSVGGMNEALANTPEGKMQQMKNRFGDLKETIGNMLVQVGSALMPLADGVMRIVDIVTPIVSRVLQPITEWLSNTINDTDSWRGYIEPVVSLVKNGLYPMLQRVFEVAGNIVNKIVEFVKTSELLKDVFRAITNIYTSIYKMITWMVNKLEAFFEKVVMPILEGIEKAYRWIKGSPASTVQQAPKANAVGTQQTINAGASIGSAAGAVGGSASGAKSASEVATGGTRNTTINIRMDNMVESIAFNGTLEDNTRNLEERVTEILLRTLNAAQMAAV